MSAIVSCSASSTIRRTSSSTRRCGAPARSATARAAACPSERPSATAIGPMTSLIPQRPTMPRAIWVSCWMSDSAPVVSLVVDDLLGRAAAERDLDLADEVVALVAVAVGLGRRERHAERLAARDDRDLAHRVGALGEHADERVAGLVVGGALAVGVAHQHRARGAEDDLLDRVGEVRQLDALVVAAGGEERRLVDQQREVGAGHARRRGRDRVEVDASRRAAPSACGCAGSPRGRCGRAAARRCGGRSGPGAAAPGRGSPGGWSRRARSRWSRPRSRPSR